MSSLSCLLQTLRTNACVSEAYLIDFHVVFCKLEKSLVLFASLEDDSFVFLFGFGVFLGVLLGVSFGDGSEGQVP